MSAVPINKPQLEALDPPQALRELKGWLCWRLMPQAGGGKPRKVPFYVDGKPRKGQQGTPEDLERLATFEQARKAALRQGYTGIGFAPQAEWGITALDFDDCVTDGQVHPELADLVTSTYAELSPSGTGVRVFVRGTYTNRKAINGEPFGMELFSSRGFVTFTGNRLEVVDAMGNADTIDAVDDAVQVLTTRIFKKTHDTSATAPDLDHLLSSQEHEPLGLSKAKLEQALEAVPADGLPYEDHDGPSYLVMGMAVHHETGGSDEGFELWDAWCAKSSKYTTAEYNRARWDSFGKGSGKSTTMRTALKWAKDNGVDINTNAPLTEDEFEVVGEAAPKADAKPRKFPVLDLPTFAGGESPGWIIKHVLPKAELVVMFGASGSGKSFMALDMAAAIARGVEWRGKKVKQGRVVYVAAEGAGGFRKRVKAYAQENAIDLADLNIGVIAGAPNMLEKEDVKDVLASIKAAGGADLIVLDTFAQVMPGGNENAGEDVGRALAHCKVIHKLTGALVMLVHHSGKDSTKGARGWSGLRAAADAELEVERIGDARLLSTTKQKDGDDDQVWGFGLRTVTIGADEDLEPITSCVVIDTPIPERTAKGDGKPLGIDERFVNDAVQIMAQASLHGIEVEAVVLAATSAKLKELGLDEKDKDAARQHRSNIRRAVTGLVKKGHFAYDEDTKCLVL